MAGLAFLSDWLGTLPMRWRSLVGPFVRVLAGFGASYAGATALLKPWLWGYWWSVGVPVLAGLGGCWWLWRPWALLAANAKGESRRVPLLFTWVLLALLGWGLRNYLRYRLGEVRDLRSVHELASPGNAVFFRLRGPFYADQAHLGRCPLLHVTTRKGGSKQYAATSNYAWPLLAAAADTTTYRLTPPAWLSYTYRADLGIDLPPGERSWRYQNFLARADAHFDSLRQRPFTYLLRLDRPGRGQYRAVRASKLAPYYGSPLLLAPIWAPFAERGARTRRLLLWAAGLGGVGISLLLLIMPLRPQGPTS